MTESNLLLTILIPTYNRGKFIGQLLRLIKESEILLEHPNIEVVIANNCSQDSTLQIISSFSQNLPNLRVINYEEHVPTSEQNVFRSFNQCRGEYVWVLGDDDIPIFENLGTTIQELESKVHDFLLFNFSVIGRSSRITSHAVFKMHSEKHSGDIRDLAIHNGCWFVLAGMSCHIMRTRYLKNFDFSPILALSPIYSHVAAYLECFAGKVTTFFHYPIVWYKVIDRDISHWQNAAKRLDVFDEYFWTLGFIRHLKYLINKGLLEKNVLFYILDQNDFRKFRLIDIVHEKLYEQVKVGRSRRDRRQLLSESDFYEMQSFLLESSIFLRESLWDIEKLYHMSKKRRGLFSSQRLEEERVILEIDKRFRINNSDSQLLYGFFIRRYQEYSIFKIYRKFYCVQTQFELFLERELQYIDPTGHPPILYIADSLEQAMKLIDNNPLEQTEDLRKLTRLLFYKHSHYPLKVQDPKNGTKFLSSSFEGLEQEYQNLLETRHQKLNQYPALNEVEELQNNSQVFYKFARVSYRLLKQVYHEARGMVYRG